MKFCLTLILSLIATIVVAQPTVNSLRHPGTYKQPSYVSNPDRILNLDDLGTIDYVCAQIEKQDSFQVVFVILESIGSESPKYFAGQLFNRWGVGHRGRDDGLLVLFVKDQRRIEFETGYGTETVLTDYQCVEIQEEYMLDFFRTEDYAEGLIAGAKALKNALSGQKVDRFLVQSIIEDKIKEAKAREKRNADRLKSFLKAILVWHLIGLILFLITLILTRLSNDPYIKYKILWVFGIWIWAILFPVTHALVVLYAKRLLERYRNMIRFSNKTYEIMRKLSEEDEDEYLTQGQITEELLRSIDYDVWITDKSDDVLILSYRPIFSDYKTCPKCHFSAFKKIHDHQIRPPTYVLDGMGQRKHECSNCQHVEIKTYYITKLSRSTSGSGGGGSWGGGGSFGGGSSGGGGGSSGGGGGGSSW